MTVRVLVTVVPVPSPPEEPHPASTAPTKAAPAITQQRRIDLTPQAKRPYAPVCAAHEGSARGSPTA
ncbi:hypothetical protein, partial [Streptomyces sp. WAC 06725]|uniref:hypothetical protein n=1 Tax=Streptomyces sp. WAC 06725 TaxID=2203209 RepID=UPI001C8BEA76